MASVPVAPITFLFGQFVPRCRHVIGKHFDDYNVIQYMHGGSVLLNVGSAVTRMEGRWWWSSYPGPRIAFKPAASKGTWVHRYLAFKGPAVERWSKEGLFPIAPTPASGAEDWAARFDTLLELSRREDALGRRRATLELERLLCELADLRHSARTDPPWLTTAKARLEDLGTLSPNYAALAAELGMSDRTFRREFAKRTGHPPHQYLLASRISHARELLAHTDLPIKQIARELGYADVFYFTRQFRHLTGVPPAIYRKSREG